MQIKTVITQFIFAMLFFFLTACTKEDDISAFEDVPVVESYLKGGEYAYVDISRELAYDENAVFSADDINNLNVRIIRGNQMYQLNPAGNGHYTSSDTGMIIRHGYSYRLEFEYNGKTVSAETLLPANPVNFQSSLSEVEIADPSSSSGGPPSFPDPINLTWDNPDGSYYLVVAECIDTDPDPIMESDEAPPISFRSEPTQGNTYSIRAQTFQYYGQYKLHLYHINADYAALYSSSGSNSQNLTSPTTNINNGLGIFTAISETYLPFEVKAP